MRVGFALVAALALVSGLALAGCSSPSAATPSKTPKPATPTPSGVQVKPVPGLASDGSRHYEIDQANLTYDHNLIVFTVTAQADGVNVSFDWSGQWPTVTTRGGDCLLGRIVGPLEGSNALAVWASPGGTRLGVRAAGQGQGFDPLPLGDQQSGATPFHGSSTFTLREGESVRVELGGSSPAVFGYNGAPSTNAASKVSFQVGGPHGFTTVAGPRLACGVGARDAGNSTFGASFYIADVQVGGGVGFRSYHGSTLWAVRSLDLTGLDKVHADFLGADHDLQDKLLLGSEQSGSMAILFDRQFDAFGSTAWAFIDEGWTGLSDPGAA